MLARKFKVNQVLTVCILFTRHKNQFGHYTVDESKKQEQEKKMNGKKKKKKYCEFKYTTYVPKLGLRASKRSRVTFTGPMKISKNTQQKL